MHILVSIPTYFHLLSLHLPISFLLVYFLLYILLGSFLLLILGHLLLFHNYTILGHLMLFFSNNLVHLLFLFFHLLFLFCFNHHLLLKVKSRRVGLFKFFVTYQPMNQILSCMCICIKSKAIAALSD